MYYKWIHEGQAELIRIMAPTGLQNSHGFHLRWTEPTAHAKAETVNKGQEKPLARSVVGQPFTEWHCSTSCVCLRISQTSRGAAWAQGSCPAHCQMLCCSQHFCFTCMLVLHFPVLTESSREDGPVSPGVDCLHCPLAIPTSAEVSSNILTCGRSLKAPVGSMCARRSRGSPCSHCAPVCCQVGDLALKRYLFTWFRKADSSLSASAAAVLTHKSCHTSEQCLCPKN